jgi:cytochrome P450
MADTTELSAEDLSRLDVSHSELWRTNAWRPLFADLRRDEPVSYCPKSSFGPYWSITRYDDIVAVEADAETFSSSWEHGGIVIFDMQDTGVQLRMFIAMDDPEHAEKRRAIAPAVTPSAINALVAAIRRRTSELLDSLPAGQPFDWVHSVSIPLTTAMIATLFDFPWDERAKLAPWSDWAAKIDIGPDPELNAERERHVFEMAARFKELYEERRKQPPRPDLLSMMAHSASFGEMDEQRFIGAIALLLVGGNDTTRNSMSGLIERINEFPDAWAQVKAQSEHLAAGAAVETIRLQTPIAHMRRTATRDVEFRGKAIRNGDKLVLWYNSGNRDEAVFPDADRWNPERDNARRHLSFGYGIHRCLGARLAELQLTTLIEEMARRGMDVKLAGEPERLPSCFTNGYEHMLVMMSRADV